MPVAQGIMNKYDHWNLGIVLWSETGLKQNPYLSEPFDAFLVIYPKSKSCQTGLKLARTIGSNKAS